MVDDWLNLLQVKFRDKPGSCVAVHCVAGLGRLVGLIYLPALPRDVIDFARLFGAKPVTLKDFCLKYLVFQVLKQNFKCVDFYFYFCMCLALRCWLPWLCWSVGWNMRMPCTSSDSKCLVFPVLLGPHVIFFSVINVRPQNTSFFFVLLPALSETFISFPGGVAEPLTPSSCSTWKATNLNCVCASKTPTDRTAASSRNLR